MKLIKPAKTIQVKRCFVIAQKIRFSNSNKRYLNKISRKKFLKELSRAKKQVLKMRETELDKFISFDNRKKYPGKVSRLFAYDACDWYIGTFKINEVGVWRRAGELPLSWTNNSLDKTAKKVKNALLNSTPIPGRAGKAIKSILATNINSLQKEKYLLPIIFKGGTGTKGRRYLKKKLAGDIDDGCMRSIALAISGIHKITAYIGMPKK